MDNRFVEAATTAIRDVAEELRVARKEIRFIMTPSDNGASIYDIETGIVYSLDLCEEDVSYRYQGVELNIFSVNGEGFERGLSYTDKEALDFWDQLIDRNGIDEAWRRVAYNVLQQALAQIKGKANVQEKDETLAADIREQISDLSVIHGPALLHERAMDILVGLKAIEDADLYNDLYNELYTTVDSNTALTSAKERAEVMRVFDRKELYPTSVEAGDGGS